MFRMLRKNFEEKLIITISGDWVFLGFKEWEVDPVLVHCLFVL
jgi:hypothetical protein